MAPSAPTLSGAVVTVPATPELRKLTFAQQLGTKLFAGSVAGVVGVSLCYPIDFAKTRLQKKMPGEPAYSGIVHVLRHTRSNAGVAGWYNGLRPNLAGIIPEKGLKLAIFDVVRDQLRGADGRVSEKAELTAAVSAAVAQVVITTPMEIVKIRCQLTGKSMMSVAQELGVRGLYKGYVSTLSRDVCFNLLFFPTQSKLKARLIKPGQSQAEKTFYSFLGGITGGVLAASASTPFDVVKTRLQAGEAGSIPAVTRAIIEKEGASALFLGVVPRCAAIAPLFGIAICVFDLQKRFLLSRGFDVPM